MTAAFERACRDCVECCNTHRLTVEFLERMAEVEPRWLPMVQELRSKFDHTQQVSETGLLLTEQMKAQGR